MSWSVTAHGHSPDAMCEGWLLHHLTELLMGNEAGLRMLRIDTDHHGQVQLGEQPDADDDATPGAP